ncbi:hypothetical protein [Bacillus wiedmannii]|uniref:hypothetical protein n=1 Tax=Bacillus wiedmannii TaxID=1890302 RepID=UPI000BF4736E|nr:hypothetical protein [Bacillus wiedmannii]PFY95275.1 hypothetical protein COL57_22825 [Bacillus wiedmannii]
MRVKDLILNQFTKGKKYEITHYDEDNGFTKYKGAVEAIDSISIFVIVYECDGEKDEGSTWIHWREIDAIEEIE